MLKPRKGFTLIELLVVVAIIGILASLLIPNAITAIQKSKQKQTMQDIISMVTASVNYATDHGEAPEDGSQSGNLTANSSFVKALAPLYIKTCPVLDQWNNPYRVFAGSSVSDAYSIPEESVSEDDILIACYGRNGADDGWTYDADDTANGLYEIESIRSYENDLINMNGSWLRAPRAGVNGNESGS